MIDCDIPNLSDISAISWRSPYYINVNISFIFRSKIVLTFLPIIFSENTYTSEYKYTFVNQVKEPAVVYTLQVFFGFFRTHVHCCITSYTCTSMCFSLERIHVSNTVWL